MSWLEWWRRNVWFVSWGKHWKGVYLHFVPYYTVRVYLWNIDWTRKDFGGRTFHLRRPSPSSDLYEEEAQHDRG